MTTMGNETKHTPGPWKSEPLLSRPNVHTVRTVRPDETGHTMEICAPDSYRYNHEQQQANARLIAAAPEMLEALEMAAVELRALMVPSDPARLAVEAAIAKARGGK